MDARRRGEAISCYSTSLSLDPLSLQGILVKRSKAYLVTGSWKHSMSSAITTGSVGLPDHRLLSLLSPSLGHSEDEKVLIDEGELEGPAHPIKKGCYFYVGIQTLSKQLVCPLFLCFDTPFDDHPRLRFVFLQLAHSKDVLVLAC